MNDLAAKTPDLDREFGGRTITGWSSSSFSCGGNVKTLNRYPFGCWSSNISQVCGYTIEHHSVEATNIFYVSHFFANRSKSSGTHVNGRIAEAFIDIHSNLLRGWIESIP
jgi:hypothetical protein